MHIETSLIDPDAAKVVRRLCQHGHTAYLVGGCVRDLLLGRTPKDFDVATSATPSEVKRLFRNCRIIGRRFRLAHVFFGQKIIETSTFRQNPRDELLEPEPEELLIRRDNVFGTAEEDARRRDFTINGLFYDLGREEVIDYVGGIADLQAGLMRTIGDPDVRLREDPVRILRAIKFAARLGFAIEPATYAAMLAHRGDIPKCAPPRILEEIYRLLRGGAAWRSMQLLVETGVLDLLMPELAHMLREPPSEGGADGEGTLERALAGDRTLWQNAPEGRERRGDGVAAGEQAPERPAGAAERFFATLQILDAITRDGGPPANGMILAALLAPFLDDVLTDEGTRASEMAAVLDARVRPVFQRLRASRRDAERARQVLLTQRRLVRPPRRRGRPLTLARREHFADALTLYEITCQLRGAPADGIEHWRRLLAGSPAEEMPRGDGRMAESEHEPRRKRRRRRGGRRRRRRPPLGEAARPDGP